MTPRLNDHGDEVFRLEITLGPTELSEWTKKQISLRSTGVVMEKRTCFFKPNNFHPEGKEETWPWKITGRLKTSQIPERCHKLLEEGWELTYGKRKLKQVDN